MQLNVIPQIPDNEDAGVISILIAIISILLGAFAYMYKELKADLRAKDRRIEEIIKSHQQDLKEGNDDYKDMIDKYYALFERVKDWHYESKRGGR